MSSEDPRLSVKTSKILKPDILLKEDISFENEFSLDSLFKNIDFKQQAKDSNGNLHPQYGQALRKGFQAISDYAELYSNDILNTMRQIDFLCIKTADRKIQNYRKCKAQTNQQMHQRIFVPIANSAVLLHKVANQCMLKGNSVDICSNLISDHTHFMFKLASERIKAMTQSLKEKVPLEFQPPKHPNSLHNNAIREQSQNPKKNIV